MKSHQFKIVFNNLEKLRTEFSLEGFEKDFNDNQNFLKNDRNVVKILSFGEIETVIKSFKNPNFIQGVIYKFFRKSKARRSYENSLHLNKKGIKTPEPIGYIEVFDFFRLKQSYFISRQLDFDFSLNFATEKQSEDYKAILKSFINFTYDLHKKNIMHLDYVVGNVCIKKTIQGYEFYLVDLNRLYKGIITPKKGVKNLASLSDDSEINKILVEEYTKKLSSSFSNAYFYLMKSVERKLKRSNLKRSIKAFFGIPPKGLSSQYVWDFYNNQPDVLNNKKLKNQISILAWFANLKILIASLYALLILPLTYIFNRRSLEKKIDSFGLCVNIDKPMDSQKLINNNELIEMIDELSIENILVRIPLADFDNLEKYIDFISNLQNKDLLVCILQDREHIEDKKLTEERLEIIFKKLNGTANKFQIGNVINRKKWSFLSVDEYFSFFKIAYDLKNNKFPNIRLLGGNIIDFDIPFFARSIFHFRSIYYDGIATQLYVDRRGAPEQKQFGFNALSKIKTYAALALASTKTSKDLYITEVNWALSGMGKWAPAKNYLTDESLQSRYLVRYYLLMLGSGKIKKCYWHQLVAPGYGLVNNVSGKIIKRDAYYCFKCLISILDGGITKKLLREKDLYCLIVEKENTIIEAIWSSGKNFYFKSEPSQLILDIRGEVIETKNSSIINVTGEVIYLKKEKNNYREINLKLISESQLMTS